MSRFWPRTLVLSAAALLLVVALALTALSEPSRVFPVTLACEANHLSALQKNAEAHYSTAKEIERLADDLIWGNVPSIMHRGSGATISARDVAESEDPFGAPYPVQRFIEKRLAAFHADMQDLHDAYSRVTQRRPLESSPANPFQVPTTDLSDFRSAQEIARRYLKNEANIRRGLYTLHNRALQDSTAALGRLATVSKRALSLANLRLYLLGIDPTKMDPVLHGEWRSAIGKECGGNSILFRVAKARISLSPPSLKEIVNDALTK
jgi:hypothetical protein